MRTDITPIDILNKRFSRVLRGYDAAAVDDFLRQVEASLSAVSAEAARLRDRLEAAEREVDRYRAMEDSLNKALVLAEKTAAETCAAARANAESIRREADSYAAAQRDHVDREMADMMRQRARFARDFRTLLMGHMEELDERIPPPSPAARHDGERPDA